MKTNSHFGTLAVFNGKLATSLKVNRDLKQHDAFNRTWWSVLSIDKLITWQPLSIERTGGHVVLKASSCLRCPMSSVNFNIV